MKKIICRNDREEIVFTYAWPFWLVDADGLTQAEFSVMTSDFGDTDGALFVGASAKPRNIVITAKFEKNYESVRQELFAFFQPRAKGTLFFSENGQERKIDYYAEKVDFGFSGRLRTATVSLICPNPLFEDAQPTEVMMSGYQPTLCFPFTYGAPIQVAHRVQEQIVTIHNPTNITTGLKIMFSTRKTVLHPGLQELNRNQAFSLPLMVTRNNTITVWTGRGEKGVSTEDPMAGGHERDLWNKGDAWLQLEPGDNVFRYTAESGEQDLEVTIAYSLKYWGA